MAPSVLPIWWCLLCLGALPAFDTTATAFTEDQQKAFVKAHNRLRTTAVPTVANMRFMTWDSNLADKAKTALGNKDKCPKKPEDVTGQVASLYYGDSKDAVEITNYWVRCQNSYEKIMSAANDKIGCATNTACPKFVLCLYGKTAAEADVIGWPCWKCPTTGYKCFGGLCISTAQQDAGNAYKDLLPSILPAIPEELNTLVHSTTGCMFCDKTGANSADPTIPSGVCECGCKSGADAHLGKRCTLKTADFDESIRLKIESTVAPIDKILPPVSRSLFDEKIKEILKRELAKEINKFCRKENSNYIACCKTSSSDTKGGTFPVAASFPGDDMKVLVKPEDVKLIDSTIWNKCDGFLYFNVHVPNPTGTTLCSAARTADKILPKAAVLTPATASFTVNVDSEKVKITIFAGTVTASDATDYSESCSTAPARKVCELQGLPSAPSEGTPGGTPNPVNTPNTKDKDTPDKRDNNSGKTKPTDPPKKDGNKPNSGNKSTTASLAAMFISCVCTVAFLCVQSMTF